MEKLIIPEGTTKEYILSFSAFYKAAYAQDMLEERGIDPARDKVAVVTSDFHIARAKVIAARQGYGHTFGVLAKLPWRHLEVNYYLREAFAMVKTLIFD